MLRINVPGASVVLTGTPRVDLGTSSWALIGIPLRTAPGLGYDLAAIAAAAQPRAEATMILAERGERSSAAAIASACALAAVI